MKKIYFILGLLLFLISLSYMMLTTHMGLNAAIYVLKRVVPGKLSVEQTSGAIFSSMTLKNLHYRNESINFSSKTVTINWSPRGLLNGVLLINTLRLQGVNIVHLEGSKREELTLPLFDRFKRVIVKQLVVNDVDYLVSTAHLHLPFLHIYQLQERNYIGHVDGKVNEYPLAGNMHISYQDGDINIYQMHFQVDKSDVMMQGKWGKNGRLNWDIKVPTLDYFIPDFKGSFNSIGHIDFANALPTITASVNTSNLMIGGVGIQSLAGKLNAIVSNNSLTKGEFIIKGVRIKGYYVPQINMTLSAKPIENNLQLKMNVALSKDNTGSAIFMLPNLLQSNLLSQRFRGKVNFRFNHAKPYIDPLLKKSKLTFTQGILDGEIILDGAMDDPRWKGDFVLSKASLSIKKLGITLTTNAIQFTLTDKLNLTLSGNIISGQGQGNMSGSLALDKIHYPGNIKFTGRNLQVINTNDYQAYANPDLMIHSDDRIITITGSVHLPQVDINVAESADIVKLPEEVVYTDQPKAERIWSGFAMRIKVTLGDKVNIVYKNLKASMVGGLTISQIAGGLPTGSGELIIKNGSYHIYNRAFLIRQGRLVYTGNNLYNPSLNIRAVQALNGNGALLEGTSDNGARLPPGAVVVGVAVRGTVDEPVVSFISRPAMSQEDILSYIVFGQPRSQISATSALSLLSMITGEYNVAGSGAPNNGPLSINMLNFSQFFRFNYPLGENWVIRSETNVNETGADILYEYKSD